MTDIERAIKIVERGETMECTCSHCTSRKWAYDLALVALHEKQERDKGCEYCADHEDLAFGHDSLKRVGSIYIDKNLLVADLYSESMAVAVFYCPMCGKRLEETSIGKGHRCK